MTTPSRQGSRHGFSLIELLVVILIITVLVGILIPVVKKVRVASQVADTQQVISQLSNAITQYYNDFKAYPGPFSNTGTTVPFNLPYAPAVNNTDIEAGTVAAPMGMTLEYFTGGIWTTPAQPFHVTGTENLVLGLMGGLNYDSATGGLGFNPGEVGLGPLNLNYNSTSKSFLTPQRTPPYVQATNGSTNGLLMWCGSTGPGSPPTRFGSYDPKSANTLQSFFDEANRPAKDSLIPDFVDRFSAPMPILYLRSHTGAAGIVSDDTTKDPNTTTSSVVYQYDIRDITPYTNTQIGLPQSMGAHYLVPSNGNANNDISFAFGVAGQPPSSAIPKAGVVGAAPDAGAYFTNPAQTPTSISNEAFYNSTGTPRAKDHFILISAGPDGFYGTGDDITTGGDVMP